DWLRAGSTHSLSLSQLGCHSWSHLLITHWGWERHTPRKDLYSHFRCNYKWELVILGMERWRREEGLVSEWEMSLGVWSLSMSQWAELRK
ncbi:hypothetical protein GBAR_LOCUS10097, partial [Geodia barretti]